jgi:hypothetical protein
MRKEMDLRIDAPGRDQGKVFHLTEMSAVAADDWACRFLLAVSRSGQTLPEEVMTTGMSGVARFFALRGLAKVHQIPEDMAEKAFFGLLRFGWSAISGVQHAEIKPLLDELWGCVQLVTTTNNFRRSLVPSDIEEVATMMTIRTELAKLHISFFTGAAP